MSYEICNESIFVIFSPFQQLTNDFRKDYAQFWISILHSDVEGIKRYAGKLGIGELFGLFACMVAGRSWSSIEKGIDKNKKGKSEVWGKQCFICFN